jgi:hypothetical protein
MHTVRDRRLLIRDSLVVISRWILGDTRSSSLFGTNPGGGNSDLIQKGGWRVSPSSLWTTFFRFHFVIAYFHSFNVMSFSLDYRVMLPFSTNWRIWWSQQGGKRSRWLHHLRKSVIKWETLSRAANFSTPPIWGRTKKKKKKEKKFRNG